MTKFQVFKNPGEKQNAYAETSKLYSSFNLMIRKTKIKKT